MLSSRLHQVTVNTNFSVLKVRKNYAKDSCTSNFFSLLIKGLWCYSVNLAS